MENNETWRERFDMKWPMVFSGNGQDQSRKIKDFIAAELLSLADKIGGERKKGNIGTAGNNFNLGLDTAISLIKEMAK